MAVVAHSQASRDAKCVARAGGCLIKEQNKGTRFRESVGEIP